MAWNYINFAAMTVGYVTIAAVLLAILAFTVLSLKEKYNDWRWKKRKEMEKQASPAVADPAIANKPAEQPTEAAKETENKPNVEISIK